MSRRKREREESLTGKLAFSSEESERDLKRERSSKAAQLLICSKPSSNS